MAAGLKSINFASERIERASWPSVSMILAAVSMTKRRISCECLVCLTAVMVSIFAFPGGVNAVHPFSYYSQNIAFFQEILNLNLSGRTVDNSLRMVDNYTPVVGDMWITSA
jgi:hypothetical protein